MRLLREAWPILVLVGALGFSAVFCRTHIEKSNTDEVNRLKQEIRYRDAIIARQKEIIAQRDKQ